ncbi:MAG: ABC transporter ATP-binding protein [Chroococcidiopsidaceae cyanobacterium CP_BM_RX_35]|nr:ABC transporter ATP-binding protein [Chroococcidiopsidaceae cyanobacterium CP_BM_RX_35]
MANLELRNLNKTYNSKVIPVKDINLHVNEGEFLTLLGPSGCGKSTTLRLIAGLEQPTRGQILIGDRDVTALQPGDRNIAMVFQSYALYPHMTVAENIASGLKLRHIPKVEIQQRVADVAAKLGLEELLQRQPSKLSGGQRQRVALGRALVRQPDVFLLDEPLSNLDALLRERVRAELKQLFIAQKAPVVYVTHDQTEAMTLSTKVAVLNNGNLQQLAPPQQIYVRPANQFVAGFVGSPQMNLLTLNCHGNSAWLGDCRLPISLPTVPPQIILGIRPENIQLANAEDAHTIEGQVFLVENLGMHNLISIRIQSSQSDWLTLRALLSVTEQWNGTAVKLALHPESLHWFDVETGERLHFQGL